MTLRLVFGLSWSLVTGLAGGWLTLSPWALGTQGEGGWSTVTRGEVGAGLGLVVLAVAGIVFIAAQTAAVLREAGSDRSRRAAAATPPEMEQALIALAQALAEDLDAQRAAELGPQEAEEASSAGRGRRR
jgi:hypothetical protein